MLVVLLDGAHHVARFYWRRLGPLEARFKSDASFGLATAASNTSLAGSANNRSARRSSLDASSLASPWRHFASLTSQLMSRMSAMASLLFLLWSGQ